MDTPDAEPRPPATRAEFTSLGPGARSYEDYTSVELEDGALMVYRPDELSSWMTSDVSVRLEDVA